MGRLSRTDHRMTRVGVWLLILVVLAGVAASRTAVSSWPVAGGQSSLNPALPRPALHAMGAA